MVTKGMVWVILGVVYGTTVAITHNTVVAIIGAAILAIVAVTMPVWERYLNQNTPQ